MERIKLNQPQAAQVQGGSYAAGIQRSAPSVPSRVSSGLDYLAMAIPALGKIGAGILDKVTKDAEIKGWVDGNANATVEQSWLTQDAYDRGQSVANISKVERAATDDMFSSMNDYVTNKSLDDFNKEKIQPYLTNIADKVRTGEIPIELGEKMMTQAMTTSATMQQEYTKRKELYHQEVGKKALLDTAVAMGDKLQGTLDHQTMFATLSAGQEQLKVQAKQARISDVPSYVSKLMANVVKQQIVGMDLTDDGSVAKLNAMVEYLATEQGGLAPEDVLSVRAARTEAINQANAKFESDINVGLSDAKTQVELGGGLDDGSLAALRTSINTLRARDPVKGAARYEELQALLRSANSKSFATASVPYQDPIARAANKQSEADVAQAIAQQMSGKNPAAAIGEAVGMSQYYKSPKGLATAMQNMWGGTQVLFDIDATKLDKNNPDVQQGAQILEATMAHAAAQLKAGNMGVVSSLLEGAPPSQREALNEWVKHYGVQGTSFNAFTHMPQVQRIADNLKMAGDTSKIVFDTSSALWRSGSAINARWFNEPNEQVQANLNTHIHNVIRANRTVLTEDGNTLVTEDGVLAALRAKDMLIAGTNAPIIMQPQTRANLKHSYGKDIPDEYIVDAVNQARNELAKAKGIDPDDVYVTDNYNGTEIQFNSDKGVLARVRPQQFVSMIQVQQDNNIRSKGYVSTVMPQAATQLANQVGATVNKSTKGDYYTVKSPTSNQVIPVTPTMMQNFSNPALAYTVISEAFDTTKFKVKPQEMGYVSEYLVTDTARNVSRLAKEVGLPPVQDDYAHPDTLKAYAALTSSIYTKPAVSLKYADAMRMVTKDPASVLSVVNALNQNKDFNALPYAQRVKFERGLYAASKLPK